MWENATRRPLSRLDEAWTDESDIARSLLDARCLVFMFELDYLNPDAPAEPALKNIEADFERAWQDGRVTLKIAPGPLALAA